MLVFKCPRCNANIDIEIDVSLYEITFIIGDTYDANIQISCSLCTWNMHFLARSTIDPYRNEKDYELPEPEEEESDVDQPEASTKYVTYSEAYLQH